MKDELAKRIKTYYEDRFRNKLLRRSYTLVRIDGKGFSKYTKGLKRPFDHDLIVDMDKTAQYVCENVKNVKCAYVQSDEMSFLLTDFDDLNTKMYFDGNIQKIVSVMASYATAKFNQRRFSRKIKKDLGLDVKLSESSIGYPESVVDASVVDDLLSNKLAQFDARVFQVPNRIEAINYFRWRIQDCKRNAISSIAKSKFSHKELDKKSTLQKIEMLQNIDVNLGDYNWGCMDGRGIFNAESVVEGALRKKWAVMPFSEEWIP